MEQTRYWMWTREGISGTLPNNTVAAGSSSESWEEQAFAADSAGHLGGCIWPPKSYTCSFCGREFRSAQALGGHMNVHRRDRARLKQSPTAISENHDDCGHHQLDLCKPLKGQHTPQLCPDTYDPNPSPSEDLGVTAPPFSPSRVSVISQETRRECNLIPRAHSSYISRGDIQENPKESLSSIPKPLMDSMAVRELTVAELKLGRENWRLTDVSYLKERDTSEDHEEVPSSKRRRTDPVLAPTNKEILRSEVLKLAPSTFEELDLELRLGDRPAVR